MTTRDAMRDQLRIKPADLDVVNAVLTGEDNALVGGLLDLVEKYGGVDEINRKADEAGRLETRLARLQDEGSPFLEGLQWLTEQRDAGAFVTLPEYRRSVLGDAADEHGVQRGQRRHPRDQRPAVLPVADRRGQAGDRAAASSCPAATSACATSPSSRRRARTSSPWRPPCRSSARPTSRRSTPRASTAATSISAAPTRSPATSAASASPTTTRSSTPTSTSACSPGTASARRSTSTAAPSSSPSCCTSSGSATSSRSPCSWASTTPGRCCGC